MGYHDSGMATKLNFNDERQRKNEDRLRLITQVSSYPAQSTVFYLISLLLFISGSNAFHCVHFFSSTTRNHLTPSNKAFRHFNAIKPGRLFHFSTKNDDDAFFESILKSQQSKSKAQQGKQQSKQRNEQWFPRKIADDDIFANDEYANDVEEQAVELATKLLQERLRERTEKTESTTKYETSENASIYNLVKGRFADLTCDEEGERLLENLFLSPNDNTEQLLKESTDDQIRGAVMIIQSLCVMGTQVGVKGPPEQLKRMVSHLDSRYVPELIERDLYHTWDRDSIRRLKYRLDRRPALALLTSMKRKRATQGAFDLLVDIGAWKKHEDLALLRSGFPLRFSEVEEKAAKDAFDFDHDPDAILGLRQDLRHLKVYTIDSEDTSEIDDGLSVERIKSDDGDVASKERYRIWVHIADADRWAPRNSALLETGRRRITSLYLPNGSIPMFPNDVSTDLMSLKANADAFALSLGIELNDDGSVDTSSIIITPSLIRVNYRLTYEDVDEMLEEGIGYSEEWQLGALLVAAQTRRQYRIKNGSAEGAVPTPIPYSSVSIYSDENEPDNIGVSINIQVSHNAAENKTAVAEDKVDSKEAPELSILKEPVSSAYLLVTESMILAGEAIGCWKSRLEEEEMIRKESNYENQLRLPFRTQRGPDYNSRARERKVLMDLLEYNVGDGLCHAWYARRFLQSVRITESQMPHSGLGLQSYVQWSSPIRRFSDLQVHASVKRYLRRRKVYELVENDQKIPDGITAIDLGLPKKAVDKESGELDISTVKIYADELNEDINFLEGIGLVGAARNLQRLSKQYWLFEYVRRMKEDDPNTIFKAMVLGCIDPERQQYAIYVYELGLEHRYISPTGRLDPGTKLLLKVDNVSPRAGLLNFVQMV